MAGKEAVVVLIDVNPAMGVARSDGSSGLDMAKRAVSLMIQQKLIFPRQDELGLVLVGATDTFNDLHAAEPEHYQHIRVIQPIAKPDISFLTTIDDIESDVCHGDVVDALLVAMQLLDARVGRLKFTKRIFLLTNAASPISWMAEAAELPSMYQGMLDKGYRTNIVGIDFQDVVHPTTDADDDDDIPILRHSSEVDRRSVQQKANEAFLRDFADAVDGRVIGIDSAMKMMSTLKKRINQVTKFRGPLEVGSVKLQVATYTKTAALPLPTMKREVVVEGYADDGQGGGEDGEDEGTSMAGEDQEEKKVVQQRTYWDKTSERQEEVGSEMRVKGFRYGKDHVPFSEEEMELLKYECDRCLVVLAFTDEVNVERWQYMSGVDCVASERGDEEGARAFSAFVHATYEMKQVALCRFVARRNARPQLVALIPDIDADTECFYLVQLPFAEDIRDFNFANFDSNPAFIPNDTQKAVAKDFIRQMNLDTFLVDEEGDQQPALEPEETWNPVLQRFYQTVQQRAQDPSCPIAPVDPEVSKAVVPDSLLLKTTEPAFRAFRSTFTLTPQPRKETKEKRKFSMYDDQPHLDADLLAAKRINAAAPPPHSASATSPTSSSFPLTFDALRPLVDHVGSVTPLDDFRAILTRRDDVELYRRAWDELKVIIERWVDESYGDAGYGVAMECVKGLRGAAVAEGEAEVFNQWMERVKEGWRTRRAGWWAKLKAEGVRVIDSSEVDDSRFTPAQADRWFEDVDDSSRVRSESLPVSVEDDADLFDSMD